MTTNKILFLRNLNDEEPENWQKFWKSFNAWFESDALNKNFIKDEYIYYNSGWYGGTYELNIDMEQEYNIEYGESYPGFNMYVDYESIKKFVEIAFSRWIKKEQRYAYTIKVNELLKKFNLSYRLNQGKLARIGDQDLESISKVNDIKLNKGDRVYSAFETYTISEFIAQGGNGKVYKAEDSRNRIIAIKVVLREQGSKLARFSNEINFCERNQNRNIIEIYDHGTIGNNMIFYVMPLAKETLRDRIKKHIQHSDAEEIFINILYGLKYAHEQFMMLGDAELSRRFSMQDEAEQKAKIDREQANELEYVDESQKADSTVAASGSGGNAGGKPVRNPEREKPKWEDTITNRMLHWSYTPEQKEEVKKALAAGVPKATILTYFYPEVTVEKMSTYRKKQ